jgi:hypothetical protein
LLTSILRTSPQLCQTYELHIRKPSFIVGNNGRYTQRILEELGLPPREFDAIVRKCKDMQQAMNLGAWIGPKEEVSAELLSGRETGEFDRELAARGYLVSQLMRRLAKIEHRPRWGIKILGDIIYADRYARVWPNATFIMLVRDPRDHALSVMKLNEQRAQRGQQNFFDDYAAVARSWRETMFEGRQVLESNKLRHIVLRYEDLVMSPQAEIKRLADVLDLDLSGALNFHKQDYLDKHTQRFKHHDNLKNPINAESVGKWRSKMTPQERAIFTTEAGDLMAHYGYE